MEKPTDGKFTEWQVGDVLCTWDTLMHDVQLFPDLRFFLFVLQNIVGYKNETKCDWMSASMTWRYLGHLQLLSRGCDTYDRDVRNRGQPTRTDD